MSWLVPGSCAFSVVTPARDVYVNDVTLRHEARVVLKKLNHASPYVEVWFRYRFEVRFAYTCWFTPNTLVFTICVLVPAALPDPYRFTSSKATARLEELEVTWKMGAARTTCPSGWARMTAPFSKTMSPAEKYRFWTVRSSCPLAFWATRVWTPRLAYWKETFHVPASGLELSTPGVGLEKMGTPSTPSVTDVEAVFGMKGAPAFWAMIAPRTWKSMAPLTSANWPTAVSMWDASESFIQ